MPIKFVTPRPPLEFRRLFMILGSRSLPYSRFAIESLFDNALENLDLTLITDSPRDKELIAGEIEQHNLPRRHRWRIHCEAALEEREEVMFANFPNLRAFRRGHPCWRKITDPVLLSEPGDEMIVLDPDLYFPNSFRFEPTPDFGVLLMWQKPSCLLPPETVEKAMDAGIRLAHHTDIGVAHLRMPLDLEWTEWLLAQLGAPYLPRSMHVESIVWAAIAMRFGGGYLDPSHWLCWRRTQTKRVLRKLGVSGSAILRGENLGSVKCFHAGGEAKWWLAEAKELGILDKRGFIAEGGRKIPFVELTPQRYQRLQAVRSLAKRLGYYRLFHSQQDSRPSAS